MIQIKKYGLALVKESNKLYDFEGKNCCTPDEALNILNEIFNFETQAEEIAVIICMDTKNNIIGAFEISRGSLNSSIIHPREVLKRALICNSANYILAHNHPSGDTTPSKEDISLTMRLNEASKIIGIEMLDHLVIGSNKSYTSMKKQGFI